MAKERSGLFKFFYVVLSIITFPIYMVIFMLRHPILVILFVLFVLGGVVYYPMSMDVKFNDIPNWYKEKYTVVKMEFVTKAVEKGDTSFIPESVVKEVAEVKKKMEEDALEAKQPKGDNYNAKIIRDDKSENVKKNLKSRKGGFKKIKAEEPKVDEADLIIVEDIVAEEEVKDAAKPEPKVEEEDLTIVEDIVAEEEEKDAAKPEPKVEEEDLTIVEDIVAEEEEKDAAKPEPKVDEADLIIVEDIVAEEEVKDAAKPEPKVEETDLTIVEDIVAEEEVKDAAKPEPKVDEADLIIVEDIVAEEEEKDAAKPELKVENTPSAE